MMPVAGCTTYRPNAITGSGVIAVNRLASLATRNADAGRQATSPPQGAVSIGPVPETDRSNVVIYDDADGAVWVRPVEKSSMTGGSACQM
jgi:hypothetical protein